MNKSGVGLESDLVTGQMSILFLTYQTPFIMKKKTVHVNNKLR